MTPVRHPAFPPPALDAPVAALLLDARGHVHEANLAAEQLLCRPARRLRGLHLFELVSPVGPVADEFPERSWHLPGELDPLLDRTVAVTGRVSGDSDIEADLILRPHDRDGYRYAAWLRDTRSLRLALRDLGRANERLDTFGERPEVGICRVAADGAVVAAEGGALAGVGVQAANTMDTHFDDAFSGVPVLASALHRALAGNSSDTVERVGAHWLRVRARPARGDGGALLVLTDAPAESISETPAEPRTPAEFADALVVAAARATADDPVVAVHVRLEDLDAVYAGLGRAGGEELVERAIERVRELLPDRAVVVRGAGAELLVMVDALGADGPTRGHTLARDVASALGQPVEVGGTSVVTRASAGVAIAPRDGRTADELMRVADGALWEARAGEDLDQPMLAAALHGALERGELHLRYQPISWIERDLPYGVEALLRWEHPELGDVSRERLIAAAEATGLIEPIGAWVVDEICRQAARWDQDGIDLHVHFNVSPEQLRRPGFSRLLLDRFDRHRVLAERFVLEITESTVVLDADRMIAELEAVRRAGVRVAIDDFGAHDASLSRLMELPADILKIDRHLLRGVPHNGRANAVLSAVLGLAETLGLRAIAEGIETDAQREFLVEHGCALGQGFKLGHPERAAETSP